jgi:hypothetical protein
MPGCLGRFVGIGRGLSGHALSPPLNPLVAGTTDEQDLPIVPDARARDKGFAQRKMDFDEFDSSNDHGAPRRTLNKTAEENTKYLSICKDAKKSMHL